MKLVEKVPKDLYKIFGSKYMEFYMQFLVALYEESSQSYSLLGLTERECQMIMNEHLLVRQRFLLFPLPYTFPGLWIINCAFLILHPLIKRPVFLLHCLRKL